MNNHWLNHKKEIDAILAVMALSQYEVTMYDVSLRELLDRTFCVGTYPFGGPSPEDPTFEEVFVDVREAAECFIDRCASRHGKKKFVDR